MAVGSKSFPHMFTLYREGLVGWEGLDSIISGSRRGRDGSRGRGGPGRGREGRGRHSGGRGGPGSGGRFDHDTSDFDQHGATGRYVPRFLTLNVLNEIL